MSEANKNIEDLFREKLDNHESIVRPDLWNSISIAIPAPVPAAATIALKTKILIGVAASVITAATVYYFNNNNQNAQQTPPQKTEQSLSPTNTENTSAIAPDSIKIEINTATATNNPKAASVNTNAQAPTIQTIDFKDQVNTDLQNLNLYYARMSSAVETTEQHNEIVSEKEREKVEDESASATSKDLAQPPVMQVKEVDNKNLLFFLFSPQKASAYEWWIDDKLVSSNATVNHNFEEDGVHQVRLVTTAADGSRSETIQNIEAYRNIQFNLPNVFSPNGDGTNDIFDAEAGIKYFKKMDRLIIRDKQGKSIYDSSTNFIWDGSTMDGNICPSGVYTYTIFATDNKNNPQMKAGTIQLFVE